MIFPCAFPSLLCFIFPPFWKMLLLQVLKPYKNAVTFSREVKSSSYKFNRIAGSRGYSCLWIFYQERSCPSSQCRSPLMTISWVATYRSGRDQKAHCSQFSPLPDMCPLSPNHQYPVTPIALLSLCLRSNRPKPCVPFLFPLIDRN